MASLRPANTTHIMNLAENRLGYDFIIGDLHGRLQPLTESCRFLESAHDRLIIAGDLLDRGQDNVELITFIVNYNESENRPGKIYSVCGNHEVMCLNTIAACENIIKKNPNALIGVDFTCCRDINSYEDTRITSELLLGSKTKDSVPESINDLLMHCYPGNGGAWLLDLFIREYDDDLIRLDKDNNVIYDTASKIKLIRDYISTLPYIIHVSGDSPYNVVHASMPVDDLKLTRLIRDNLGLTDEEIDYAIWARPDDKTMPVTDIGRHAWSEIVYVGHTIIRNQNMRQCIDTETNTVYLDTASYITGVSVVVNHLNHQCMFTDAIVQLLAIPDYHYLGEIVDMVQWHLSHQNELSILRKRERKEREARYNVLIRHRPGDRLE